MRGDDPDDEGSERHGGHVSPACAGMIPNPAILVDLRRSEPRMRGDDPRIAERHTAALA